MVRVGLDSTNFIVKEKIGQSWGFSFGSMVGKKQLVILQLVWIASSLPLLAVFEDRLHAFIVVFSLGVMLLLVLINLNGFLTCWSKVKWL